jgi:2-methylisocitrate lyase-like PEP mutase family enzyme
MKSINHMAERLREQLDKPQGIEVPGCYDVLSAMILERAGFEAVFMSGYGIAASLLGNPDIGLTSLVETALVARNISHALRIPLIVDADNGYGNEDSVARTVHELEHAGAAAMILEDQVFPKRCGHAAGKSVIPLDQYMRKLDCALQARQTPLVIVARTDATSIDEGIMRAKEFHAAGADVTLIDGLPSIDVLKRIGDEVPGHKVINLIHGGKTPLLPSDQLHALGFKIVLYSTPALYTAVNAMLSAMSLLKVTRRLDSISDQSISFREFQQFIEEKYFDRRGSGGLARASAVPEKAALRTGELAGPAPIAAEGATAMGAVRSVAGAQRSA